jgi:Raf kinase inhibitor-like YbhB/YbcL family protein
LRRRGDFANMPILSCEIMAMRNWASAGASLIVGLSVAGASGEPMTLTSPDLAPGARVGDPQVGDRFGCAGGNRSPELMWSGAPAGVQSFVVSLFDPDAPTGAGFWHWMMFDIPASATSLPPGAGDAKAGLAPPGAVQGKNDAGATGYFGPCPPEGDKPHRYRFELDALDVAKLELDAGAAAATVAERARRHTLAKATLTGTWSR